MKYRYTIIFCILCLVINLELIAQGSSMGNWVVSSSYISTGSPIDEQGYLNYSLNFSNNGISSFEVIDFDDDMSSNHFDFAFSLGAYDTCSNHMDTYVTDTAYYVNDVPLTYAHTKYDHDLCSDALMFPCPYDGPDYLLFYGTKFLHKSSGYPRAQNRMHGSYCQ